jgi:hypothetical protein
VKDLYKENYKPLKKGRALQKLESPSMFMDW